MREDSEGYAKLVVALNHFSDSALKEEFVEPLYKEIQVKQIWKWLSSCLLGSSAPTLADNPLCFYRCKDAIEMLVS